MLGRLDYDLIGPRARAPVPTILEGEALKIMVRALNSDLAVTIPTSARYRIDDANQGTAVLDWATLTPSTSMSLIVTSAQNAMRNGMRQERRQLVIECADSDGPIRRTLDYDILDIAGVN